MNLKILLKAGNFLFLLLELVQFIKLDCSNLEQSKIE